MKKFIGLVMIVMLMALTACAGGDEKEPESETQVPAQYSKMTNPHAGDQAAIDTGQAAYQANCATCHGDQGKGDGPAGQALNPPAKDLTQTSDSQTDGYLYWRISDGGAMPPFNSAMPAWKGILSEDQIWQVVSFIRSLQ